MFDTCHGGDKKDQKMSWKIQTIPLYSTAYMDAYMEGKIMPQKNNNKSYEKKHNIAKRLYDSWKNLLAFDSIFCMQFHLNWKII